MGVLTATETFIYSIGMAIGSASHLCAYCVDSRVYVWDVATQELRFGDETGLGTGGFTSQPCFSNNDTSIIIGGHPNGRSSITFKEWDVETATIRRIIEMPMNISLNRYFHELNPLVNDRVIVGFSQESNKSCLTLVEVDLEKEEWVITPTTFRGEVKKLIATPSVVSILM